MFIRQNGRKKSHASADILKQCGTQRDRCGEKKLVKTTRQACHLPNLSCAVIQAETTSEPAIPWGKRDITNMSHKGN